MGREVVEGIRVRLRVVDLRGGISKGKTKTDIGFVVNDCYEEWCRVL